MNAEVKASKRKFVVITDPHLKVSTDYVVYSDAVKQGVVINNQYGNPFVGNCWPGKSVWVDFLNQNA
jgi:alpha 1,3-glucosidase